MRHSIQLLFALAAVLSFMAGCSSPQLENQVAAEPMQEPTGEPAQEVGGDEGIVEMISETSCYAGPGFGYKIASYLDAGQYFQVIGIDDEITWIEPEADMDTDEAASIDDEITWFQINPTALGDPDPPPAADPSSADTYALRMVYRCWLPDSAVQFTGDLAALPVIYRPILVTEEQSNCYSVSEGTSQAPRLLEADQIYEIIAIDDEITWITTESISDPDQIASIDDEITWIDDEITWFLIDPNAVIDPEPPMLDRVIDPDPPMLAGFGDPDPPPAAGPSAGTAFSLELGNLCWVRRDAVRYGGDLARLPVLRIPVAEPSTVSPTASSGSKPPTKEPTPQGINCSAYTTYTACMQHSNQGCAWDDKTGCYLK